jgi:hypothetical protein
LIEKAGYSERRRSVGSRPSTCGMPRSLETTRSTARGEAAPQAHRGRPSDRARRSVRSKERCTSTITRHRYRYCVAGPSSAMKTRAIARQHVIWNFATALYYKSGGMPWRPSDLPDGVCFVDVSFHHLKKRGGHLVYASAAQAFSSDHEPFCLKGPHIDHEQRIDRQPYLNESQAFSMMRDVLAGYEMRTGVQPKRVVVHKTSMYHCEEEKGFREAARGIVPGCDLVWLRQTPFRLVRKGSEEPWRGTLCRIERVLPLHQRLRTVVGRVSRGHIPVPIQIGSAGDTDIEARAREILTLPKMNWNSSDGEIMTALSDNVTPNPSFRFHT